MKKKIVSLILLIGIISSIFNFYNVKTEQLQIINNKSIELSAPTIEEAVYWIFGNVHLNDYLEYNNFEIANITKIIFNDINRTGKEYTSDKTIDVSKNRDNSVKVIVKDNVLYIQYNGTLYLNPDSHDIFYGFANVTEILGFEYVNTSQVTNMNRMFGYCEKLQKLDLSHFDTSNVTDMRWMFIHCENIQELNLSSFDTSKVTDMNGMFSGCKKMSNLNIKSFDTSNVTDMQWMFNGCENIQELDLSNFDTSKVTNMIVMFSGCKKMSNLNIKSFNTSNVTNMKMMFNNVSLKKLDLSHFDTSKVTDMNGMFANTKNLIELNISGFDTSNVIDMQWMFYYSTLHELDLSNFDTSKVIDMSYMFRGNTNLKAIYVSNLWNTNSISNRNNEMFVSNNVLVGGNGTKFNSSKTGAEMAVIDTKKHPGYLTLKKNESNNNPSTDDSNKPTNPNDDKNQDNPNDDSTRKDIDETVENPKTGTIGIVLISGVISALGIGTYYYLKKKEYFKKI